MRLPIRPLAALLLTLPLAGCPDPGSGGPTDPGLEEETPTETAPSVVDPTHTQPPATPTAVTTATPTAVTTATPTAVTTATPTAVTTATPTAVTTATPTAVTTATPTETPTPTTAATPTLLPPTEAPTPTLAPDADGDGYRADADCDDGDPAVNPGATELCNGVDDDCDGRTDDEDGVAEPTLWYPDFDSDSFGDNDAPALAQCAQPQGYADRDGDCNDSDPAFYPGAAEEDCADPNDYNCDGQVGYADEDGDGWAACEECDDGTAAVNPDAQEVCNGVDDDCDGDTDDADEGLIDPATFHPDADGDGYGDPGVSASACAAPEGYVADGTDCDDQDPALNPQTVWYLDFDEDGFGGSRFSLTQCLQPQGYLRASGDCDDADPAVNPGAQEVCDGMDDDCDDLVDDADPSVDPGSFLSFYADADGDGYGDPDVLTSACVAPEGYVSVAGDCDDGDPDAHTGAEEVPNGRDDDCDGIPDDGLTQRSCLDYHRLNPALPDGVYPIDPDGPEGEGEPFEAWCDMTTDGGGWTLMASLRSAIGFTTAPWSPWSADWFTQDHGDLADPNEPFTNLDARRFAPLVEEALVLRASTPGGSVARYHYGFTAEDWALWGQLWYAPNSVRIVGPFNRPGVVVSTSPDGGDAVPALSNGHWDTGVFYLGTAPGGGDTDGDGLGARFHVGSNTGTYGYVADVKQDAPWHLWIRRGLGACDDGDDSRLGAAPGCPAVDCLRIHQVRPDAPDGIYWIDPDSPAGPVPPFEVSCDMSTDGGGWTVLHHDRESLSGRVVAEDPDELALALSYDAPDGALAALSVATSERRQSFYKRCYNSIITREFGGAHVRAQSLGGDKISLTLQHFDERPLACNLNDNVYRESQHTLADKADILPILRLWAGDSGDPSEEAYYQLGPYRVRRTERCDNGADDDGDGRIDEGTPGDGPLCAAPRCAAILAEDPAAQDGDYWLDPDGAGVGADPFLARCDMSGGGWTIIGHDRLGQEIDGDGVGDKSQLVASLVYDATVAQMSALLEVADAFEQDFRKDCYGAIINTEFGSQHNGYISLEGSKLASTVAWFGVSQTPCDLNDAVWRVTEHTFSGTPNIPILSLWGGDTDASSEDARYQIGALRVH